MDLPLAQQIITSSIALRPISGTDQFTVRPPFLTRCQVGRSDAPFHVWPLPAFHNPVLQGAQEQF